MGETAENSGPITEKRKGRLENLRPWPRGTSGNPGGRPRGLFGKAALRQLRKRAENGETALERIIAAQIEKAIRKRDTRSAEFLRDTVDGRPATGDSERMSVGTINILWAGEMPAWAQPQVTAETIDAMPSSPAVEADKLPWAQQEGDAGVQRQDTDTEAQSADATHRCS